MTSQEAFRLGFFLRLAEDGLSPALVAKQVTKAASLSKRADPISATLGVLSSLAGFGTGAALLAPPLAGYGAGWLAARARDEDIRPEDLQKQDIIAEYRRLAQRARAARLARKLQETADGN